MKTNQMLTVNFGGHRMQIEHKTGMGNLTELWGIGNAYRMERGLNPLDLADWLRRPQTEEFVRVVEYKLSVSNQDDSYSGHFPEQELIEKRGKKERVKSPLIKTKRGRYAGTWAHLYILLDAATYLDAMLKFEVYETFINNKLLEWRDKSGDEFIALNLALDAYIPGRDAVEDNKRKWLYINMAMKLRGKILGDDTEWNKATPEQLAQRTDYEKRLIDLLKMGVVKDENHLLEMISKL